MTGIVQALVGGVLLGAVNTFGDFFWEWMNLRHRVAFGVAHGALAMTTPGDTSTATLAEVERVMRGGSARVSR